VRARLEGDERTVSEYAEQQSTLVTIIERNEDRFSRDEIFTLYQRFCSLDVGLHTVQCVVGVCVMWSCVISVV
jgi:hypothetical protein